MSRAYKDSAGTLGMVKGRYKVDFLKKQHFTTLSVFLAISVQTFPAPQFPSRYNLAYTSSIRQLIQMNLHPNEVFRIVSNLAFRFYDP